VLVSTVGETLSFTKSKAIDSSTARNAQELYSLAKAKNFNVMQSSEPPNYFKLK
jgi:hypothetical protein